MPRSSGGTYTLYTPGNPVVTNTIISSTWANNTLTDIATAMTDSLSRTGQGGMTAPLQLANGTVANPGLTWGTETTSGLYRAGAGDFRFAIGSTDLWTFATAGVSGLFSNGVVGTPAIRFVSEPTSGLYRAGSADFRFSLGGTDFLQLSTNLVQTSGTAPAHRFNETDGAANNRLWDIAVSAETMRFQVLTDALAATSWLTVDRTAGVVDSIALSATALSVAGPTTYTTIGDGGTTAPIILSSVFPQLNLVETDASADNRVWNINANLEQLRFRVSNDANNVVTNWLAVDRTGTTIDIVNFPNGLLQYGGVEVGYRGMPNRGFVGNDNTVASDRGSIVIYNGAGGNTFTVDSDFGVATYTVMLLNAGTGSLTIAESLAGNLFWFNGSGALSSGSRTLAVGGVATVYMVDSGNVYIWGTGLS